MTASLPSELSEWISIRAAICYCYALLSWHRTPCMPPPAPPGPLTRPPRRNSVPTTETEIYPPVRCICHSMPLLGMRAEQNRIEQNRWGYYSYIKSKFAILIWMIMIVVYMYETVPPRRVFFFFFVSQTDRQDRQAAQRGGGKVPPVVSTYPI